MKVKTFSKSQCSMLVMQHVWAIAGVEMLCGPNGVSSYISKLSRISSIVSGI
jgi:hypothetical protein